MRKKTLKLIVTFYTTADAMAAEKICREKGRPGRLIPVPREFSAGCGLAWCTEVAQRALLCRLLEENGVEPEEIHECFV